MSRQGRAKAVSVLVVTIGLCGAGVLAAAPLIGSSAAADAGSTRAVVAASPTKPEPPENAGPEVPEDSDLEPEVTVTVTVTPEDTDPVEVTETVTVTPKKPKKPKPTKPVKTPPPAPDPTTAAPQPQPLPSQEIPEIPANTATADVPDPSVGQSVSLPAATATPLNTPPSSQATMVTQAQTTEAIAVELREGTPETDRVRLSRQLGIPALVLTLLALFAVLFYEKKLRRMAHAAAVRTAGPGVAGDPAAYPGYPGYPGYPAGPGYVANYVPGGYPAGPAYTTVVSFVPVPQQPVPPYEQQPVLQLQPEADAGPAKPTDKPAAELPSDPPAGAVRGPHDRGGFDDFTEPDEGGKSASTWFSPGSPGSPAEQDSTPPPYRMPADTPRYGPEPPPTTPDTTAVYVMPELPEQGDDAEPPAAKPEVQEGPGGAPKRGLFKRRKP
ncbi:hypothetical protein [Spongiactinospora sp. 9N601]|uniref:hypothetical protein n=1 Tax=Spongiactinospora sp. 9N601 TaxID=3375149 RepID=UPI0037A62467